VCRILKSLGYELKGFLGDHKIYEDGQGHNVHVDMGEREFGTPGMTIIIRNTGLSREEFYGATKESAKKIGIRYKRRK